MDTLLNQRSRATFDHPVAGKPHLIQYDRQDPLWMRILFPFTEEDFKSPIYWFFLLICTMLVVYTMNGGFDDTLEPMFRSLGLIGN